MLLLVKTVKRQVAGGSVLARRGKGMVELIKPTWLLLFFVLHPLSSAPDANPICSLRASIYL